MKTDPTFWLLARASGLTAYALLTTSVLAGLTVKSRPLGARSRWPPSPTYTAFSRYSHSARSSCTASC